MICCRTVMWNSTVLHEIVFSTVHTKGNDMTLTQMKGKWHTSVCNIAQGYLGWLRI